MAFGKNSAASVVKSITSLRRFCDLPITVVGTEDIPTTNFIHWQGHDPFVGKDPMPKLQQRFMAGYVKPFLYDLSPYDRTLYVDADTEFRQYPMEGFKRLNKEDFLIYKFDAKDNHVSLIKAKSLTGFNRKCIEDTIEDAKKNNEPFPGLICSGVIFFKKSPAVSQLFKDWYSEWMKYYE
jgi:hypothetical protein